MIRIGKEREKGKGAGGDEPRNLMLMVPHRAREHIQKEWQVGFPEPRFRSGFWNRFFVCLGASEHLMVRLDRMGSEIWGHIDGERNVRRIHSLLELTHPGEENLRDRLVDYLKRLEYHGYIELREPVKKTTGSKINYALPQELEHPPRFGIDW